MLDRRKFVAASFGALAGVSSRSALAQNTDVIKIGVITDLTGPFKDIEGPTGVVCAKLAAQEFMAANPGIKVAVLSADHQNKADIGLGVIREWLDRQGVDLISDVGNSAVALGARTLLESMDKVAIVTSAGSSDLTGKSCSPQLIHWGWDTWCLAHSNATAITRLGGKRWFFITANYAFGHSMQTDSTKFIEAAGGQVVGSVAHPIGTSDFSSFLLQAQAAKPDVIAFANAGADMINCMKQAREFGMNSGGIRLVATVGYITDVLAMGRDVAEGLTLTETFYWDLNDRTRAFTKRLQPLLPDGVFPNMCHAGNYSGVMHYLNSVKEVGVVRAKASGRAVVDAMKRKPFDDDCFGSGIVRADGRSLHPAYLFTVKRGAESKSRGDVYKLTSTSPAEEAFRALNQGGCEAVKI